MQISFIKEIVSNIIGKSGEQIVDILYKKKNVNEFLISKKLNLTINQTRNLLYKLSDKGTIHFIRKKDSKKGGWYTYFWTLDTRKSLELLKEQIDIKIKRLEEELEKRRNERFYFSPGSGIEYTEEQALEHNFICPEAGDVLQLKDNKDLIDSYDIELSKLKLQTGELEIELGDVETKRQKQKERKIKIETKKKEQEKKARREKVKRKKKRDAKAAMKAKEGKKSVKPKKVLKKKAKKK